MRIIHHQDRVLKVVPFWATTHSEEMIASSGVTFQLWRLYQHAWLVCLIFPLIALWREPISLWHLTLGLLALVGFAIGYTWLMWAHPVSRKVRTRVYSWFSFVLFGTLSALALVFSLVNGPAWLWLFIGVSAMAGILLPMRSAFAVIVLLTLFPFMLILTLYGGMTEVNWWWLIAFVLLVRGIGLDMIGVARMGSAIRELHTTRRELARLAVIEERLRLSRDLHDLLGQTLSVITLKSELARGLVQEEPVRCAQELVDIERVSRQMLREVRKTVAGYRQPTLANELDGARQLLEAAGVEHSVEQTTGDLPPDLDAILAWTIREGVTNVIRHSRARECLIRLVRNQGMAEAMVLNDGERQEDQQDKQTSQGNGLSGLRERVAAFGGTMEAGSLNVSGKTHFRLRAALPSCRVVILTTFGRSGYLRRAMDSGAVGFLLKDAPASQLASALRRVMNGERVVDPELALLALSEGNNPLTPREREVLTATLPGISHAEIAARLSVSEGTVRNHLSAAMQKLGAHNRMEAARRAEQKGWL